MLSKEILKQYTDLKKEIADIQDRLKKTEAQITKIEAENTVKDTVTGGSGGNQHYVIEGFPYPEYSRKKTRLFLYKAQLETTELELAEQLEEVEAFIQSIDDSRMRRIIRYKIVDGLTWDDVTAKMGYPHTVGSIKMAYQRFMDETC